METMQEWFALKAEHQDFTIQNDTDAELFFARAELDKELQLILRRSFRTETPPKMVLYGDWGVGKTHTMRHIEYEINRGSFPATVVFVELPDITAKSTFQVAHSAFLDALGREQASEWILEFQTKHGPDSKDLIREHTQSGDIATAFANMLAVGEGGRIAWDWLRGMSLSATDARLAGLPPSLEQSNQLVRVLQMFGRFAREVKDSLLVLMLDEATKLDSVTNADAVHHWQNAFKLLADAQSKEVGLIVSASWVDPDDMAIPLSNPQVMSRFGEPNYIPLPNLDEEATREFVQRLLEEWSDSARRGAVIEEHEGERDSEELTDVSYPFTVNALEVVVAYACRRDGFSTPRDIQETVNNMLNRAMDDDRHLASAAYVNSLVAG
jgi:Cdc6-like AAA superfamily ATPase